MAVVTLQIFEGLERGRVLADLPTPITIGREDDNHIRLNDERVSRFHAKIQEDGGRIIFTDLDSTNGSRVNGHPTQMKVLKVGDQLTFGRCMLIYGSSTEIAAQAAEIGGTNNGLRKLNEGTQSSHESPTDADSQASEENIDGTMGAAGGFVEDLFPLGPPEMPSELTPIQRAQLSDQMAFVHEQIRIVLQGAREAEVDEDSLTHVMEIDWIHWQRLLKLEMNLAEMLRAVAEPEK